MINSAFDSSLPKVSKILTLVESSHNLFSFKLEVLDTAELSGYRQHSLAYMYLCFLTNGYIWQDGDQGVPKVFRYLF